MPAYTYILRCSDDTFYVGSTAHDLSHRVYQHNETHEGAAYTRRRRPVTLIWFQEFDTVTEAHGFERKLHGWSRAKKLALIEGREEDLPRLSRKGFHKPGRMDV